jgi:YD repeat-containing protein
MSHTFKLLILFSLLLQLVKGQELPKIISTSPQAAAFLRYGEIPVDYSTGVPKIEIPLYTLETSFVNIPIFISYHASGIKVTDVPTPIGLGWVLNAGGAVTRTIIGKVDESWSPYSASNPALSPRSVGEMDKYIVNSTGDEKYNIYAYNSIDKFSDKYSYYTNNYSGSFRLEYATNRPVSIPYDNNIINLDNAQKSVEIIDIKGNHWIFSDIEYAYVEGSAFQPSSWYLTKITNVNKTDSIMFEYIDDLSGGIWTEHRADAYYGCWHDCDKSPCIGASDLCTNPNDTYTEYKYHSSIYTRRTKFRLINTIKHNGTLIKFSYSADNSKRFSVLDSFYVYNSLGSIVKSIQFSHSYFGSGDNTRTRLDQVKFGDSQTTSFAENYSFTYNTSRDLPQYIELNKRTTTGWENYRCSEDFWGYYNGSNQSFSSVPKFSGQELIDDNGYDTYSSDRLPKEDYAKTYIIESITYPTGGKSVFDFESNYGTMGSMVYDFSSDTILGGLRLKKSYTYNKDGDLELSKEYHYSSPVHQIIGSRLFSKSFWMSGAYQCDSQNGDANLSYLTCSHFFNAIYGSPVKPITNGNGSIVYYGKVEEIVKDRNGSIGGKTVYQYESQNESNYLLYYSDTNLDGFQTTNYDQGTYAPLLSAKESYKYENGTFNCISKEWNNYEKIEKGEFTTGLEVEFNSSCRGDCYPYSTPNHYEETKAVRDVTVMTTHKEISIVNNKEIIKNTEYSYNDSTQISQESTQTSNNHLRKIQYKYPYDFLSQTPYSAMCDIHILNPVIEKSEFLDNAFLRSTKTNYANWDNNLLAPISLETKTGSGIYETRLKYGAYDSKGNPLYIIKDDITKVVYLWGYNNQYPIAKIEGLTYDEVKTALGELTITNLAASTSLSKSNIEQIRSSITASGKTALVTTYTYAPLIGLTMVTDPRGVTTTYNYDSFNRLMNTQNDDGKLLNKYFYHYANQ